MLYFYLNDFTHSKAKWNNIVRRNSNENLRSTFVLFIVILHNVHCIIKNISYRTMTTGSQLCYEILHYILYVHITSIIHNRYLLH